MSIPRLVVVQTGTAAPEIVRRHGDYPDGDSVAPVPPGAPLLASKERCATQALRGSDAVASVQFHPELRADTLRDLIDSRAGDLGSEGLDPAPLRAGVRETESARLLRAFADEARRS